MKAIVKAKDLEIEITDLVELGNVTAKLDNLKVDYNIEFCRG